MFENILRVTTRMMIVPIIFYVVRYLVVYIGKYTASKMALINLKRVRAKKEKSGYKFEVDEEPLVLGDVTGFNKTDFLRTYKFTGLDVFNLIIVSYGTLLWMNSTEIQRASYGAIRRN